MSGRRDDVAKDATDQAQGNQEDIARRADEQRDQKK